jgi:hypothetical protein
MAFDGVSCTSELGVILGHCQSDSCLEESKSKAATDRRTPAAKLLEKAWKA